jgi:hypothetical protein
MKINKFIDKNKNLKIIFYKLKIFYYFLYFRLKKKKFNYQMNYPTLI